MNNSILSYGYRYQITKYFSNGFEYHDYDFDEPKKQDAINKAYRFLANDNDIVKIEIRDNMRPKQPPFFIERP